MMVPARIGAAGIGTTGSRIGAGAGLGVAPLIWAAGATGVAAAGAAVSEGVQSSYESGWLGSALQWLGVKDNPSIPTTVPGGYAPPAPQTGYGMTHWSPEWQNEASAQQGVQFRRDQAAWASVFEGGDGGNGGGDGDSGYGRYVLMAVAVAAAFMVLGSFAGGGGGGRRRRRG